MQFTREDMKVVRFHPKPDHEVLGTSRCSILINDEVLIYKLQGDIRWTARTALSKPGHRFDTLKEAVVWLRLTY